MDVNDCCNCAKFLVTSKLSLLIYSFNAAVNFVSNGKLVCSYRLTVEELTVKDFVLLGAQLVVIQH